MKNRLLLFFTVFLISIHPISAQLPTEEDRWNYVGVVPPSLDSMRLMPTGFAVGRSGYVGLGRQPNSSASYNDFYKFTYDTVFDVHVWAPVANFPIATYGAIGFGIGGKGYVFTTNVVSPTSNLLYAYDTLANTWSQVSTFPGTARAWATCFVVNNKAYICTGAAGTALKDVWQYDPSNNSWTQKSDFPGAARYSATSFNIGNKGYLGSGAWPGANGADDFWEYEPVTDTWTQKANIPGGRRHSGYSFGINNRGYVTQGASSPDTWEYNPVTNTWIQKQVFPPGCTQGASFNIANRGYAGMGVCNRSDIWFFVPGKLSIGNLSNYEFCIGDSLLIPYTTNGLTYQNGNEFIVEIDSNNQFNKIIGRLSSTAPEGVIRGSIPASVPPSVSGHRFRIRATNPAYTGGYSANNLSMLLPPPQPTITRNGNVLRSSAATGNQWYNVSGPISGATGQTYTVTSAGTYYVRVTTNGCKLPASTTIQVQINSVDELWAAAVHISPNPAGDIIHIEAPRSVDVSISPVDGKVLIHAANARTIHTSGLPQGLYIIRITDHKSGAFIKAEKMIKQ